MLHGWKDSFCSTHCCGWHIHSACLIAKFCCPRKWACDRSLTSWHSGELTSQVQQWPPHLQGPWGPQGLVPPEEWGRWGVGAVGVQPMYHSLTQCLPWSVLLKSSLITCLHNQRNKLSSDSSLFSLPRLWPCPSSSSCQLPRQLLPLPPWLHTRPCPWCAAPLLQHFAHPIPAGYSGK